MASTGTRTFTCQKCKVYVTIPNDERTCPECGHKITNGTRNVPRVVRK